jgi:hypothetical protein
MLIDLLTETDGGVTCRSTAKYLTTLRNLFAGLAVTHFIS